MLQHRPREVISVVPDVTPPGIGSSSIRSGAPIADPTPAAEGVSGQYSDG